MNDGYCFSCGAKLSLSKINISYEGDELPPWVEVKTKTLECTKCKKEFNMVERKLLLNPPIGER